MTLPFVRPYQQPSGCHLHILYAICPLSLVLLIMLPCLRQVLFCFCVPSILSNGLSIHQHRNRGDEIAASCSTNGLPSWDGRQYPCDENRRNWVGGSEMSPQTSNITFTHQSPSALRTTLRHNTNIQPYGRKLLSIWIFYRCTDAKTVSVV
jgi:hypothetical protein